MAGFDRPSPGNNTASDTDTQGDTQVDLAITKTDGQTTYVPGTAITYTIAVTNAGPSHAGSFTITDLVPAAITNVMETCVVTGTGACGTNASSGNTVSLTNASLAPGAGNTLTVTVTGTSAPVQRSAGQYGHGRGRGRDRHEPEQRHRDRHRLARHVAGEPGITKTGPASVLPGGTVNYTLTVSNAGPSDALDVTVSDPTPSGLTFVSNTGDCTTSFPCTLGALTVGATRTIPQRSTFRPAAGCRTDRQHRDGVEHGDGHRHGEQLGQGLDRTRPRRRCRGDEVGARERPRRRDDRHHRARAQPRPQRRDGRGSEGRPAPGVPVRRAAATQGVYDPASGLWTVGALAVSATAQLVITATATEPGSITNLAVKTGQSEPDPNPANDSGGSTTNVAAAADLAIDTSVDRADALVGETVTFIVRATNRGPSAATGVAIAETLTPGLTVTSSTPSQGSFAGGLWTVGAMDAARVTLTLVAARRGWRPATNAT
jgi:uncharacterized repeat protein (TIGR01451 family)